MAQIATRAAKPRKDVLAAGADPADGDRRSHAGRGTAIAILAVFIAFVIGFLIAPRGHGGLVIANDRDQNLWALVPTGWKDQGLVAPYGSGLARWAAVTDARASETVLAMRPSRATPQLRASRRAGQLRPLRGYSQTYLGPVEFAGGRIVWLLQYSLGGTYTAVFEFDACTPAIAMTVTLDAPSAGSLRSEEDSLPEGAEPVCDGPAFTSPDRGDLAIPLHLPY
ncbi:MAG TPA: hypothetical protein VHM72_11325, partial [Solirubrobacteraceae bacterium]|jgi:hypothetical protein|nr:hypothetical protein [Solirubrobacteraceae bacterium]